MKARHITVKLFYADGDTEITPFICINVNEAVEYYVGKWFTYWDAVCGCEKKRQVINIQIM